MDSRTLLLAAAVWLLAGNAHAARADEAAAAVTAPESAVEIVEPLEATAMAMAVAAVEEGKPQQSIVQPQKDPRDPVRQHVVRKGETLYQIAQAYGLKTETVQWTNDISDKDVIRTGRRLYLLPVDGVAHRAEEGQTLDKIADLYGVPLEQVLEINSFDDHEGLSAGTRVIVPGARPLPATTVTPLPRSSRPQRFIQPVSRGRVTSRFGLRVHPVTRKSRMHTGLDLSAATGTSIKAVRSGRVVLARTAGGYGNLVILDHGNGLRTYYGHCSKLLVNPGQSVKQGQIIARSGATGMVTGPHLHFEVRKNGTPVNPTPYLKGWK